MRLQGWLSRRDPRDTDLLLCTTVSGVSDVHSSIRTRTWFCCKAQERHRWAEQGRWKRGLARVAGKQSLTGALMGCPWLVADHVSAMLP
jgi:hypothetical protein